MTDDDDDPEAVGDPTPAEDQCDDDDDPAVVGLAIFLVAVLLSPETKGKVLVADLTVA